MALEQTAGRADPVRSDSRRTRARLVAAVPEYVETHGVAPNRLADLANSAGVSVATAYRWFRSIDDAVLAYNLRLVEQLKQDFDRGDDPDAPAEERLLRWNRTWVATCLKHGPVAVRMRSREGFLRRRRDGDPVIRFVCDLVEPLLAPFTSEVGPLILVWNAVSDPREVLDLHTTLHWGRDRIARLITTATIGAASSA